MIISRKLYFCVLIFLVSANSSLCQNASGAAGVINGIKLSNNHLYAESTSAVWREASDNATDILRMTVEDWLYENGIEADVDEIMEEKKVIRARRSELYRAFIYLEKPALSDIKSAETVQNSDSSSDLEKDENQEEVIGYLTSEEKRMLEVSLFDEIEAFISELRGKNVIRDYGKYSTMPEGRCYLFVYNRDGSIVAAIRKDGDEQINLKKGEIDDVSSYKGCGAIWFRIK